MDEGDTTFVDVDGARLCVQTFGAPGDPAVLLIAGMSASMDGWDERFCARLAAGGRYVIRYDHRDTGQSTCDPPGTPSYVAGDLVRDAITVLDRLQVTAAHVAGVSMGAALAQRLTVEYPARVASLALFSTTAIGPVGPDSPELPPPSAELREYPEPAEPDWHDRAAVVDYLVAVERRLSRGEFDEIRVRELARRTVDRSACMPSRNNHALLDDPEATVWRIDRIAVPTLVVHGTADPAFPYPHGQALAATIPGATLLPLPGVGHQAPPRATWDTVVPALLRLSRPGPVSGGGG